MEEFENQSQQPETTQDASGTSRRNFLKVAVVSSAAAAAAVGGAGVAATALASRAPSGLSKLLVLNSNVVSTTNACFTHTTEPFTDDTPTDPYSSNASMFFWAWFGNITTAGSYTISISSGTPLPSWIGYQNPTNSVAAYANLSGCPTTQPTSPIGQANTMPITFSVGAGVTSVLLQLHLKASKAPAGATFVFTVEMTGPGGYDTTATQTAYFA